MPPHRTAPGRAPLRRALLLVLATALVGAVAGLPLGTAGAATGPTVTVTPNTNLTDGQQLAINIKADPAQPVFQIEARVCRDGVAYQPTTGNRPAGDFELGGPNCPPVPLSSSADVAVVDSTPYPSVISAAGETTTIRVGTGVVTWTTTAGQPAQLACDEAHPCALVVELKTSANGVITWTPVVQTLHYLPSDPIAGCGGPAAGILATGGPDRLQDAWIQWTLQGCRRPGQAGAPTRGIFSGEGEAMLSFDSGQLDLAYSAAGYDARVGLVPSSGAPARAAVPVPVGLNAVVLAVAGGRVGTNGKTVPYRDIKLTLQEAAALISGGAIGIEPYQQAIFDRNPELAQTGLFANNVFQVGATSTSESTHWFATTLFHDAAAAAWKVPSSPFFAPDSGKPRSVDASLALASPSFSQALNLFTGRPSLRKNLISVAGPGGAWVLTDLETARATGMTVVQLINAAGESVSPTPASMQAAVKHMERNPEGQLLPNPAATAPGADGVVPYPLTFVEYAVAPAEPLVDPNACTLRTGSQALLADWLAYATGRGQSELPDGMLPLTPDLAAEAAAALPKVGAAEVTGPCKDQLAAVTTTTTTTPPTTAAPSGESDGVAASFDAGSFSSDLASPPVDVAGSGGYAATAGGSSASAGGPAAAGGPAPTTTAPPTLVAATAVPDFAGSRSVSRLLTLVSLLLVIGLTSVAAFVSAGRRRPPASERPS